MKINSTHFFKLLYLLLVSLSQCKAGTTQSIPSKFIMITTLYNEVNAERLQEYITCMERNLQHKAIDEIVVLYDSSYDDEQNKMLNYLMSTSARIKYIKGRPTYKYCFDFVNQEYPDARILLTNGDIYFNGTLLDMTKYDLENKFIALTRLDVLSDGSLHSLEEYSKREREASFFSQDVWMFKTPIKQFKNASFELGTYACDSYIAQEAYVAGLKVMNLCLSVQACHLHVSPVRCSIKRVIPGAIALPVPWSNFKNILFYQLPQ